MTQDIQPDDLAIDDHPYQYLLGQLVTVDVWFHWLQGNTAKDSVALIVDRRPPPEPDPAVYSSPPRYLLLYVSSKDGEAKLDWVEEDDLTLVSFVG